MLIQLRLLANMLDRIVALQYQGSSKVGDFYNQVPSRIADAFFGTAGYAAQRNVLGIALGWSTALLAIGTAYVRAFGELFNFAQDYSGPLAKPQRMFLLRLGCWGEVFQETHAMFSVAADEVIICSRFLVCVVQLSDVFQYIFGKLFGRHPVVPTVNPNKTIEGPVEEKYGSLSSRDVVSMVTSL